MEEKKLITLEDVMAGIGPIVMAEPQFIYPQQELRQGRPLYLC